MAYIPEDVSLTPGPWTIPFAAAQLVLGGAPGQRERSSYEDALKNLPPADAAILIEATRQSVLQSRARGDNKPTAHAAALNTYKTTITGLGYDTKGLPLPNRGPRIVVGSGGSPDFGSPGSQIEPVFGLPVLMGMTIPSGVFDIFKGSAGAKAIGGAKTIMSKIPSVVGKGIRAGGSFGGIVAGTIAEQGLSGAIDSANADQDAAILKQMKAEDAANKKAVDEINKARRKAGLPIFSQVKTADTNAIKKAAAKEKADEKARQKAMDRAAKKASADQKRTDRAAAKAANKADRAAKAVTKALERKNKQLDQRAKSAAKKADAERKRLAAMKTAKIRAAASLFGRILIGAVGPKTKSGGASRSPTNSFYFPQAPSFTRADSFVSLGSTQASGLRASTIVATKTAVQKCTSDAPKRKKGFCRSGFFRETPNNTTYKVWSERKCQ
jgi:hypothetical protein